MDDPRRTIVRNTLANAVSEIFRFTANLLLLPLIVSSLGILYYGGLWVVISALTLYLGLIDLGTSTAYVKFISAHYAREEWDPLNEVVNTGLGLYSILGFALCGMVVFFGKPMLSLVGVPAALLDEGHTVFIIGMAGFAISQIGYTFASVLVGIQRMDLSSYASLVTQVLNVAGTIVVLKMGWGIKGLMYNVLFVAVGSTLLQALLSLRTLPTLRLSFGFARSSRLSILVRFGYNLQVTKIAQLFVFQFDRLLTLRFFGPENSTLYDIGSRLNTAGRTLSSLSTSALIPAVSHFDAQAEPVAVESLYRRSARFATVSAACVFIYLIVFAGLLLRVWMGEGYEGSLPVVQILAVGYLFNVVATVASSFLLGIGRADSLKKAALLQAGVSIPVALVGAFLLGRLGIAVGTTISLIVGGVYLFRLADRHLKMRSGESLKSIGKMIIVQTVAGLISGLTMIVLSGALPEQPRPVAILAGGTALYLALSALLLFWSRVIRLEELRGLWSGSRAG